MRQALHTWIWGFSSSLQIFSSSVRLHGDCRWTAIFRSLQRCWIGFKSGLWLGHSRTFTELSLSHSCIVLAVLRVIVLLEGEPSAQSEVLSALDQVFIKNISVLCSVQLSLNPLPVPATEKHHHSMKLPPPCFTVG